MVLPGGRRNPYTDRAVMTASKSYLYLLLLLCSRNPASARRGGLSIIYVCLFQFSACLPNEYIVCCTVHSYFVPVRYRCRCRYRHCTHAESNRWGNAHSACPRCLAAIRLWHGTLLVVPHALRTSAVSFPFVLERLSNTTTRLHEPSPRTPDLSRRRPWESNRWGNAHSGCRRGLPTMWLWHGTLLVVPHALRTSAVSFPFVLERLSNTTTTPSRAISAHARFEPSEAVGEEPVPQVHMRARLRPPRSFCPGCTDSLPLSEDCLGW